MAELAPSSRSKCQGSRGRRRTGIVYWISRVDGRAHCG